jgi:hypothetical protein
MLESNWLARAQFRLRISGVPDSSVAHASADPPQHVLAMALRSSLIRQ